MVVMVVAVDQVLDRLVADFLDLLDTPSLVTTNIDWCPP
jgi:hypothetical protein